MKTLLAYLAGTIDADGYITIAKRSGYRRRCDGTKPTYYDVRIGLTETHALIPDLLHETFPGFRGHHQPKNPAHRLWHIWTAYGLKARDPLTRLLPYLRLKKEQAALAIAFLDLMEIQKRGRFMGKPLSIEQQSERESLYDAVTHLNAPTNRRRYLVKATA